MIDVEKSLATANSTRQEDDIYIANPFEGCQRLVAVGDLHGDWDNSIRILLATRLVKFTGEEKNREQRRADNYSWAGHEWECLIQTGDIVDRGEFSKQLYDLFDILREQSNGRVINLIGNHELMNLNRDWRYVNEIEHVHWGGGKKSDRKAMWNGAWGDKMLETYRAVHIFNNTMFLHAGLEKKYTYHGDLARLNDEVKDNIRANRSGRALKSDILYDNGPLWSRHLSQSKERAACPDLETMARTFKIERMVVGHTPVDYGKIKSRCGGHYVMIDTFISKDGYGQCWQDGQRYGCQGGLNFLELVGGEAYKNEVSPEGEIKITKRALLKVKKWYHEKQASGEEDPKADL